MERERPYLDPNLALERLARQVRVPAKALSVTINRATGENVSRYVKAARIAHAQALLLAGETVTEAMLSAGFNTKSNFNREFLRVTGASPSDWLHEARRGA
ncbi:helix-turn-helix domain-containing protein [Alphaproteobacteria bacterium GH1-50]|uniref:Helix-turn-helix domain-containing protein n=1 Tax=Kangsaoukella pontilimi TaxID=2691042 RepID=A0A7C9MDS3_9RHOB|nr:AraC family transcriptional regulator [Kangsaoukella pontilimi]MXQ07852.1 helix-turn-helix domain-containing protein [Kangsaoukella pontilimi]